MATQHPEHLVVIVCWSTSECILMRDLVGVLDDHPAIHGRYRCLPWDWTINLRRQERPNWKQRIFAPIALRSRKLQQFLRQEPFRKGDEHSDPEITLIAYGKSCRVVKNYLLDLLFENQNDWRGRRRFRQVILVSPRLPLRNRAMLWSAFGMAAVAATSYIWSRLHHDAPALFDVLTYVGSIGSALMIALLQLFVNQEALSHLGLAKFLDAEDVDGRFEDAIVNGSKRRAGTWPIPTQTLLLGRLAPTTDHADVIANLIHTPRGHKNVYEVELEKVTMEIGPLDPAQAPDGVRARGLFDNRSHRRASLLFSEGNNTSETDLGHYDLKYRTNGCMELDAEPIPNFWTEQERGDWIAHRKLFHYRFRPDAGATYPLGLVIYGGFNEGDRSAHNHVDVCSYVRKFEYTLDLRPYLAAGWTISRVPEVYYFPPRPPYVVQRDRFFPDESCDCLTTGRNPADGRTFEFVALEPGLFQWTIYSIRNGGIFGFIYDVTAPDSKFEASTKPGPSHARKSNEEIWEGD